MPARQQQVRTCPDLLLCAAQQPDACAEQTCAFQTVALGYLIALDQVAACDCGCACHVCIRWQRVIVGVPALFALGGSLWSFMRTCAC